MRSAYSRRRHKFTAGCFPFHEPTTKRRDRRQEALDAGTLEEMLLEDSARIAKRLSECSFASVQSYVFPAGAAAATARAPHIPFIDECASTAASDDELEAAAAACGADASRCSSSSMAEAGCGGNGFCSDSGFSSELYDSSLSPSKSNSFRRAARWTTSFRRLIKRMSARKQQLAEN